MTNIYSYLDGVADGLKESQNDVIEELEKIREKYQKLLKESMKDSLDYTVGIAKGIEIIDERISELKGE